MMSFVPEEIQPSCPPFFQDAIPSAHDVWVPMVSHGCTFGPDIFSSTMMNLVRNPNLNSTWLFRADILYDDGAGLVPVCHQPLARAIAHMTRQRTMVRKLIPRSERRDAPLNQTCIFYSARDETASSITTLVVFIPHALSDEHLPFYHPKVSGIAHLHQWNAASNKAVISVHFLTNKSPDTKLGRVAYHLLKILHKHGQGLAKGYQKRVHHDLVISQAKFQDQYAQLKAKYARRLITTWAETTDPQKHVFEDLGIAAFLIELWKDMYPAPETPFPGFVDVGCGNGLLVYILVQEGFGGWGFDARARKSWAQYTTTSAFSPSGQSLEQRLLLPTITPSPPPSPDGSVPVHNGQFPRGTFIISNHADELTPWTPILATVSQCPFISIPCCSHDLTGARFRAPRPRDPHKSSSTYSSLVDWVARIAEDCGWVAETEMLRIPSTRNTCILGRSRCAPAEGVDVAFVLRKHGGVEGFFENVVKLLATSPRTH